MNNITIQLCAEDRARLDKLTELLEAQITVTMDLLDLPKAKQAEQADITEMLKKVVNAEPTDTPKNAAESPEISAPSVTPKTEEAPTAGETVKQPAVTMEMLRSKAITLAAAGKKDQVREVVHPYASKVTDLPEAVWSEVYAKLTALEG